MGEVIRLRVASSEEGITLQSASGSLAVEAVSPRVSFTPVEGGTRMDVTDIDGTKSTIIHDGGSVIIDDTPTAGSPNAVSSGGVKTAIDNAVAGKQDKLTFDELPTLGSQNPVKSGGVRALVDAVVNGIPRKVSDLTDDSGHYTKPDGGIPASDLAYGVIPDVSGKQDLLSFDQTPTLQSQNPVTSNGIKQAIDTAYNQISGETDLKLLSKIDRVDECTEGNFAALDANGNIVDSGSSKKDFILTPVPLNAPVLKSGHYVIYTDGINSPNNNYSASDYVDVGGWNVIRYKRTKTTSTMSQGGMAFYNAEKTYISGVRTVTGQNSIGYYGMYDVEVPENAVYARFTMIADTETYGEFELYGLSIGYMELQKKADKVNNAVSGNFAALNANGNLVDSGAKASDFLTEHQDISGKQDALTFDSAPTSGSTNPVTSGGVYTALQAKADPVVVETVSGTDPVITGADNHRYVCGTVDTLTLTPPVSGIVDVVFTSGTTPTVLSVPSGIKWPDWFDPSALEASVTYEINIMDGVYGAVGKWT